MITLRPASLEERMAVVEEAKTWLRTPYRHYARFKGFGADCAQMPIAVYSACGIIPDVDPSYTKQWHLNRGEELYLEWVRQFAVEIPEDQLGPGDFMVWRWGRTYSHGGIVLTPPKIIHAYVGIGVTIDDYSRHEELKHRPRLAFTVWES